MTKQVIGIGTSANDGSGDPLRTAFDKVNDNFDEVYADIAALTGGIITAVDIMRVGVAIATGAIDERFDYTTPFTATCRIVPFVISTNDCGISNIVPDSTGFDFDSANAGTFGFIALIEVL
jgi:hypothetical protein